MLRVWKAFCLAAFFVPAGAAGENKLDEKASPAVETAEKKDDRAGGAPREASRACPERQRANEMAGQLDRLRKAGPDVAEYDRKIETEKRRVELWRLLRTDSWSPYESLVLSRVGAIEADRRAAMDAWRKRVEGLQEQLDAAEREAASAERAAAAGPRKAKALRTSLRNARACIAAALEAKDAEAARTLLRTADRELAEAEKEAPASGARGVGAPDASAPQQGERQSETGADDAKPPKKPNGLPE